MLQNPLYIKEIREKIKVTQDLISNGANWSDFSVERLPCRDVEVRLASKLPKKLGLSYLEGRQRLLHDLASIELQAMELCIRTLIEYQGQGIEFKFFKELEKICYDEATHCGMCIDTLEAYGGHWGMFPVHMGLWNVSDGKDSILERILKVHRYLEGSGLDASFSLLNRIKRVHDTEQIQPLLERIATDEVGHVQFGSFWFAKFCEQRSLNRVGECKRILKEHHRLLPRRREHISLSLREKAGFTKEEVLVFQEYQKTISF